MMLLNKKIFFKLLLIGAVTDWNLTKAKAFAFGVANHGGSKRISFSAGRNNNNSNSNNCHGYYGCHDLTSSQMVKKTNNVSVGSSRKILRRAKAIFLGSDTVSNSIPTASSMTTTTETKFRRRTKTGTQIGGRCRRQNLQSRRKQRSIVGRWFDHLPNNLDEFMFSSYYWYTCIFVCLLSKFILFLFFESLTVVQ